MISPLNGRESEQTLGDADGQGSLARCSPWGHKESDTTERLNNNNSWETKCIKNLMKTNSPPFFKSFKTQILEVG